MSKKTKQPKQQMIDSLLEDLKDSPNEEGLRIGPNGIEASGVYSEEKKEVPADDNNEKTTLLDDHSAIEISRPDYGAQFYVNDESKQKPFAAIAQDVKRQAQKNSEPEKITASIELPLPIARFEQKNNDREVSVNQISKRTETKATQSMNAQSMNVSPAQKSVAERENRFVRAENSKLAQDRILELEHEIDRCQKENEMIASAHELAKNKLEELLSKNMQLERQRNEFKEVSESELKIFKEGLQIKDNEIVRLRSKVEELEIRFTNDLRKVRVRERDLEARLELAKAEKTALMRAKDDTILELKRKQDSLQNEIDSYQRRVLDLSQKIDLNQEQFARTVRALRLALTNLEVNEETTTVAPLIKKAE